MLSPSPEQSLENRKSQGKVKYSIVLIKIIIKRLVKQLISNGEHSFFSEKPDKKDAQSSKNRNLDMPLISAPSGRFPWARFQPLPLLLRKARRKKDFRYAQSRVFSCRCSHWIRRSALQLTRSTLYKKIGYKTTYKYVFYL